MKKVLAVVVAMVFGGIACAQSADPIFFREKSFDFGDVNEAGGTVVHEFQFTNLSGRPIRIINIQPSCGCTTSGWTEGNIAHGKSGFVKANFDPQGRPGYFSKTLTVTTDFDGSSIVLQIKGNVVTGEAKVDHREWAAAFGSLRAKTNSINFGKVFINKEASATSFALLNTGTKPIRIIKLNAPSYLKVNFPSQVNVDQMARLTMTFDAKAKGQYGFVSESIELETDDADMPRKLLSVYATVEESFPPLSAEELATAPVLALDLGTIELGSVNHDAQLTGAVYFGNAGKKDLIIRYVQSNCTCLATTLDTMKVKSGQRLSISYILKTPSRSGPLQKAITIYSNDPRNPVQRVVLSGLVQ